MNNVKNYQIFIIFCTVFLLGGGSIISDNRIVCYLKNASDKEVEAVKKLSGDIRINDEKNKKVVKKALKPDLGGFKVVYGGFRYVTEHDGLISFPLRHTTNHMYIAITPKINVVKIKDSTISHTEYIQGVSKKVYKMEKKVDSEKIDYWEVSDLGDLKDQKISPLTMIILSKPENLFIKTGHFMATKNPQVILPDIFIVGDIDKEKNNLENIDINKFFEEAVLEKKKVSEKVLQKKIKNS